VPNDLASPFELIEFDTSHTHELGFHMIAYSDMLKYSPEKLRIELPILSPPKKKRNVKRERTDGGFRMPIFKVEADII
jgi:hypothetical protein